MDYKRDTAQQLEYDNGMEPADALDSPELRQAAPNLPLARKEKRHWSMNLIGLIAILAVCYWGEVVLVTVLVSALVAFILAPLVDLMMRLRLPRSVASAIAVLSLLIAGAAVIYFSYSEASDFLEQLPKYTSKIQEETLRFTRKAEKLDVLNGEQDKNVLRVRPTYSWTETLTRGFGSMSQVIVAASFVPFLIYFMLTWLQHVRSATVMLFPMESRHTAYVTLGLISAMIRSFMVGNLLIGLLLGTLSTLVFWALNLPFFYFVGFISGFLSLVPYMGLLLALAPPLFVGIGHIGSGELFYLAIAVVALHLAALNIMFPKFLGNRLKLNPLAVTISALIWTCLWGGMGLLLSIPITAATKIFFDHVESLRPYGAWLGE